MTTNVRWTVAEVQAAFPADDGQRYELAAGELHVATQPHYDHQAVLGEVFAALRDWNGTSRAGRVLLTPGVVFAEDEAVAPDLVWLRRDRLALLLGDDGKLHGAPDLAVEVLSPGTQNVARDRETKRAQYGAWGVQEYWIVDRFARTVEVYRLAGDELLLDTTLGGDEALRSPLLQGFSAVVSGFFVDMP